MVGLLRLCLMTDEDIFNRFFCHLGLVEYVVYEGEPTSRKGMKRTVVFSTLQKPASSPAGRFVPTILQIGIIINYFSDCCPPIFLFAFGPLTYEQPSSREEEVRIKP